LVQRHIPMRVKVVANHLISPSCKHGFSLSVQCSG
jgi:hypothetical protein